VGKKYCDAQDDVVALACLQESKVTEQSNEKARQAALRNRDGLFLRAEQPFPREDRDLGSGIAKANSDKNPPAH
jgi:hypothetical protein